LRLSELSRKELVDLGGGDFWGPAGKADLLIDRSSGKIKALLLPGKGGLFGIGSHEEVKIPWSAVVKIGGDTIIVQIEKS
jgi:YlmC/YmxH family sporulation protein